MKKLDCSAFQIDWQVCPQSVQEHGILVQAYSMKEIPVTDTPTELDLVVGSLINVRPDEDLAEFEEQRDIVSEMQDLLRERGIEVDLLSRPGTEVWEGGIEALGSLYQLSRLAARLERDADIQPVLDDGPVIYENDLDRFVTDIWDEQIKTRFAHLINLQGAGSYYLPVAFDLPVWLPAALEDEDEAYIGSAVMLQKELTEIADMLRAAGVPVQSQAFQCLDMLRTGAAQSLQADLPLIIW